MPANRKTQDAESGKPGKRMRKGTHCCTQCRRRKIRCSFIPGVVKCSECSLRGLECVKQGEAVDVEDETLVGLPPPAPVRRVSYSVATAIQAPGPAAPETSDLEFSSGPQPPLVSALNASQAPTAMPPSSNAYSAQISCGPLQTGNTCETFRSSLPSYDAIITALTRNGGWWESFRQKTRVITQSEPVEPLRSFAAQAYTSTSAAKLGVLTLAYARSLGSGSESHRLFALVDSLVISDFSAVASIEGMECLILLAKTYTDIGQPRRAWLMWRKGLAIAQLLGLHRAGPTSNDIRQRLWLAIYHGDRFTSLLLGLPHGFGDAHIVASPPVSEASQSIEGWISQFVHECAVLAGNVIESIITPPNPSFATAMQLEEMLTRMFSSAPKGWWDIPEQVSGNSADLASLVDRVLIHFFFFHIRLYAHLPFLKPTSPSPSHTVSRSVCTDAARNLLKRFLILRTTINGESLFDCRTSDFVGFTAAVTLLAGLDAFGKELGNSEDECLLRRASQIFEGLEKTSGCKVASQCRKALVLLTSPPKNSPLRQEVFIPYFGKVTRIEQAVEVFPKSQGLDLTPAGSTLSVPASDTTLIPGDTDHGSWMTGISIDYSGYQGQQTVLDSLWGGGELANNHGAPPFGLDLAGLDIDQDWTLFLNPL